MIREEGGISCDLNTGLEKLLAASSNLTGELIRDVNNNDQRNSTRIDRLIKPENVADLNGYLLRLIAATQSALDDVCNESSNQNFDTSFNFTDSSHTGTNFDLTGFTTKSSAVFADQPNPIKSEKTDNYLSALDKEKLLIYKEQLEQTIRKLSADLVAELEAKDSIYSRRDELFLRIESLTRQW